MIVLAGILLLSSCKDDVLPPQAFGPVPDENQMAWHEREKFAFIHFTTNTFTDKAIRNEAMATKVPKSSTPPPLMPTSGRKPSVTQV
jgi:hypothetical protein